MRKKDSVTIAEKILQVARKLDQQGQSPFSAEALAVACWQDDPAAFSLKGYPEYPSENRVATSVMGARGLVRRGMLRQCGEKLYALPAVNGESPPANGAEPTRLSRDVEKRLRFLLDSAANVKFMGTRKQEITFGDACTFWGVQHTDRGETIDERLKSVVDLLREVGAMADGRDTVLRGWRVVTAGDVRVRQDVHGHMASKFERLLTLLRKRVGK